MTAVLTEQHLRDLLEAMKGEQMKLSPPSVCPLCGIKYEAWQFLGVPERLINELDAHHLCYRCWQRECIQ